MEQYPVWDYHPNDIVREYPFLEYYFPDPKFSTYQVKVYWKHPEKKQKGYVFIMNNDCRPHQGKCLNRLFIENRSIVDSFHTLTEHETLLYEESHFPSLKQTYIDTQ